MRMLRTLAIRLAIAVIFANTIVFGLGVMWCLHLIREAAGLWAMLGACVSIILTLLGFAALIDEGWSPETRQRRGR